MIPQYNIKLKCVDCGADFIFFVNEQNWYKEHGFDAPKRCRYCRRARKQNRERRIN